tara:strand:+ start:178 stop:825 length:648 start_codon:yes stop_codon:yes gene_type:complete
MITYSSKEAAVKLGVSTRAVQKRCIKAGVRKKDNMYLITDILLKKWEEEIKSNVPTNVPTNEPYSGTQDYLLEIESIPLEQLEFFKFKFKRYGEDELKKGNLLFVPEDLVSVEYTPEEYSNMKLNLENYTLMETKLDHKDELHAVEIKRIEQSKENKSKLHIKEIEKLIVERDYYKNSYYYVRRQNKDFLSLVMLSGKESMIKTVKDAKNTKWKE